MPRFALPLALLLSALGVSAADPLPSIEEKTAGMTRTEAFLPFYWDGAEGKVWLEVERFGEDFLYVEWLSRGLGYNPIGLDRAQLGSTAVVRFERIGPKVLLKEPNQRYRALTRDPGEQRAVEESFAASVHWGAKIAAETGGRVLVDATPFVLRDSHDVAGTLRRSNEGEYKLMGLAPFGEPIYLDALGEIVSTPNARNIAYTSAWIAPHTDNANPNRCGS